MSEFGPQTYSTYRVSDPIENLQLRVVLRRRGSVERAKPSGPSAASLRRPGRASVRRQGGEAAAADEAEAREDGGGEGEPENPARSMCGGEEVGGVGSEDDESVEIAQATFRWQEKVFGKAEVKAIRKEQGTQRKRGMRRLWFGREAQVSSHIHKMLRNRERQAEEAGEPSFEGELLHTRINAEGFVDSADWNVRLTTSAHEQVSPLARDVLSRGGGHRERLGESSAVSMWILAELPSTEARRGSGIIKARIQALSKSTHEPVQEEEPTEAVVLCSLRLFQGGRLDVRPGLSLDPTADVKEGKLSRWFQLAGGRYEYKIENLSERAPAELMDDKEKTGKMVQKRGQTGAGRPVLALDFQMPPRKHAVLYHSIEIIKTTHFGDSPHFVQFYALASAGWTIRSSCIVSAVTQTSSVAGSEKTAVFCFPIELVLESDGVPSSSHPPLTLFFSVMSVDMWERHRQLGYAHFSPRAESGYGTCQVGFWRVAETRESAMHTFFVGGIEEMRDLRSIAIPEGFSNPCLNKYGLTTNSSGKIHLRVSTLLQQEQDLGAATKPRARPLPAERPAPVVRKQRAPYRAIRDAHALGAGNTVADRVQRRLEERSRAKALCMGTQ